MNTDIFFLVFIRAQAKPASVFIRVKPLFHNPRTSFRPDEDDA
ncbi:hypothetical protein [Azospirillum doebereinerae]